MHVKILLLCLFASSSYAETAVSNTPIDISKPALTMKSGEANENPRKASDSPANGAQKLELNRVQQFINSRCYHVDDASATHSWKQICSIKLDAPSGSIKLTWKHGRGPISDRDSFDSISSDYVYTVDLSQLEAIVAGFSNTEIRLKCKQTDCIKLVGSGKNSTAPGVVVDEKLDTKVSELYFNLIMSRAERSKLMRSIAKIISSDNSDAQHCKANPQDCAT